MRFARIRMRQFGERVGPRVGTAPAGGVPRSKGGKTEGVNDERWNFAGDARLQFEAVGRKSRKKVLISAGKAENKRRMLPCLPEFLELEVDIYSTPGTHKFLATYGIESVEIHKITDRRSPNILTFLKENRFDLVINVLTGDDDTTRRRTPSSSASCASKTASR